MTATVDIETAAHRCGLTVAELRQRVAQRRFPYPCGGGERFDPQELAMWCRAEGVTPWFAQNIHLNAVLRETGLSEPELWRLVRSGEFPAQRNYRNWDADSVKRWIALGGARKVLGVQQ